MTETWAWDTEIATGADPYAGGAVPFELPADLQRHGVAWPTPADQVSDHSAEGAPWVAATSAERQHGWEYGPPGGGAPRQPQFVADHAGPDVPYDAAAAASYGQTMAAQPGWPHAGTAPEKSWPQLRIGRPFTIDQGSAEVRHLATDAWDPTGKRVSPPDAPSAPHELYGSQHYTRPRLVPYEPAALFNWNWAQGQQFPVNPGYYGVQSNMPVMSPRPQGAVAAQMPSDPYVADSQPTAGQVGTPYPDYGWEF